LRGGFQEIGTLEAVSPWRGANGQDGNDDIRAGDGDDDAIGGEGCRGPCAGPDSHPAISSMSAAVRWAPALVARAAHSRAQAGGREATAAASAPRRSAA